jgi:N-acyl-D-aspartate/D-glutamate deacylase
MKQARDTAYLYGLYDRGTLEVGKKADINVIDLDALAIQPPVHVHDLPTGTLRYVTLRTTPPQPSPAQPSPAQPSPARLTLL